MNSRVTRMRELELKVLDEASIRELAAGHRLKLVSDNVTVAEIVPTNLTALSDQQDQQQRTRMQARTRLLALMNKGIDMGGFKITNRDELYDRD